MEERAEGAAGEHRPQESAKESAERLLATVRDFTAQLSAGGRGPSITLDSQLDRDLGLDSLSRAELLLRVEGAFGVGLPDGLLTTAQTPRDLLRAVLAGGTGAALAGAALPAMDVAMEAAPVPEGAKTLLEVLDWHVDAHPDRTHINLIGPDNTILPITYRQLHQGAAGVAAGLLARGLLPGQSVAIMLPTGRDYLFTFLGVLLAGGVPVPIYPPVGTARIADHLRRHAGILNNARVTFLVTLPQAKGVSRLLTSHVESLRAMLTVGDLTAPVAGAAFATPRDSDVALLQYTSGSTGRPKGVILTHANLLANIRAFGGAVAVDATDVCVSWLPLYHDMGLIGAWLGSLYHAVPLVLMSPLAFLARPGRWLWAIHHYRGTVSAAPNFAYELCLSKLSDRDIEGLDLSSWRAAINGAEPVSPETVRRFASRFAAHGFRPQAMTPVYGLAECAVGLAFPPRDKEPAVDRIQRDLFEQEGRAVPVGDPAGVRFVSSGIPLPGHQIRIVDESGREVSERKEGRLEFCGPSATSGYFRNPDATARLFHGEWLDSGDLAYVAGGEVYITARVKDVIIRAGRNLYPNELDEAVGDIPGVRKGCVVTFAARDKMETERLVILAETRQTAPEELARLRARIVAVVTDRLGEPPDDVVLAPPHTILKTSSGKIRRADSRMLYERGHIGGRRRQAVWWQLARLLPSIALPLWRRMRRRTLETLYAAYAWGLMGVLTPLAWGGICFFPSSSRWRVARGTARVLAWASGTPLSVRGLAHVPQDRCVLVANHASYLDTFVLVAALPSPVSFVAKAEFRKRFLTRLPLTRMRATFVERFDLQRGVADARRAVRAARSGRPLLFFPEGTFYRMPGLHPFHMGAFVAAAEAGIPVVPVVIRGTRSMLRADSWFPRRGRLEVSIQPPIAPEGTDWAAAVTLRNAARAAILAQCGEPDMGREGG